MTSQPRRSAVGRTAAALLTRPPQQLRRPSESGEARCDPEFMSIGSLTFVRPELDAPRRSRSPLSECHSSRQSCPSSPPPRLPPRPPKRPCRLLRHQLPHPLARHRLADCLFDCLTHPPADAGVKHARNGRWLPVDPSRAQGEPGGSACAGCCHTARPTPVQGARAAGQA